MSTFNMLKWLMIAGFVCLVALGIYGVIIGDVVTAAVSFIGLTSGVISLWVGGGLE